MTKQELESKLQKQLDNGEITIDEAEHEWQDFVNPESRYCAQEW